MSTATQQAPAPTNNTAERFPCEVCGKPAVIVLGSMIKDGRHGHMAWDLSKPPHPRCAQHCGTSGAVLDRKAVSK